VVAPKNPVSQSFSPTDKWPNPFFQENQECSSRSPLTLKDQEGKIAILRERETVRYLKDGLIAHQGQPWATVVPPYLPLHAGHTGGAIPLGLRELHPDLKARGEGQE
jgi:hypothetical protein